MNKKSNESERLIHEDKEKDSSNIKNNKTNDKDIRKIKQTKNENSSKNEEKTNEVKDANDINTKSNEEIEILREEKLRLLAEMENLRKRSQKDKIDSIKYGNLNFAKDILALGDNLTRALDAISSSEKKSESFNQLIDGLKIVQKEFMKILKKHGVKKIESINKKFDHNYHQAMLEIETDEFNEGFVVKEMQGGFTMHDRLLRPSMVGVSKKPENKKKI